METSTHTSVKPVLTPRRDCKLCTNTCMHLRVGSSGTDANTYISFIPPEGGLGPELDSIRPFCCDARCLYHGRPNANVGLPGLRGFITVVTSHVNHNTRKNRKTAGLDSSGSQSNVVERVHRKLLCIQVPTLSLRTTGTVRLVYLLRLRPGPGALKVLAWTTFHKTQQQ